MPARHTAAASALVVRGATVVTMDPLRTLEPLDIVVDRAGRVGGLLAPGEAGAADRVIDASGLVVVPGLV
ncbi:MAG: hypothetical protein M3336_15725, partial [Chloroflexota bacterium]|nr:hypothetical protein [Chloroflexota bacterium]